MISRVIAMSFGGLLALAYVPQCDTYMQLRKVTGYYECVRPEGVRESILISGYGMIAWSNGEDQQELLFELKSEDLLRMATADAKGEATMWQDFSYTRQGDELYLAPKLSGSSCERWVQRKAPSKDSRPESVPNPLQLSFLRDR